MKCVAGTLGALSVAWLAAYGAVAQAQAPAGAAAPAAPPQQDFSAVEIKPHQVSGNFYYLEGRGGNIGVLVGDDGVLMIDDQFAPLTDKIMTAVKSLSSKPVRMLVNTHVHGDHTGGNENVGKLGIQIVAHDNVRTRLARGLNGAAPYPVVALPVITYGDTMALHLNGEDIQVGKLPPAHTDGDSYIRLPKADVIHVGDVFRTTGYPGVDVNNGGTVKGTVEALQAVVDLAGPNTKIVPGHGVVSSRADVAAFRDATVQMQQRISDMIREGMTLEQVIAAKPTADLHAKFGAPADPATANAVTAFYNAIKNEQ